MGTGALSVQMIARREIFPCDTRSGPKSTRFATNAPLWIRSAAHLAELGRRSCGADVAGWLNATVPLDAEPAVRAVLDTDAARSALLEPDGKRVHLDNAAIRLSSILGRYVTQACALALYDRTSRPDVIHYRSRHDDAEDCWAIFDFAAVEVGEAVDLSPTVSDHAAALRSVAELWDIPLPPTWR